MRSSKLYYFFWGVVLFFSVHAFAQDDGRIYGRITTVDGGKLEGYIRWDKNEASWVDILNGSKEIPREYRREAERRTRYRDRGERDSFRVFGFRINGNNSSRYWSNSATSGIRFGHIERFEPTGRDRALLILKSGQEVEFEHGSTDIGREMRELIIEDDREGEVELEWRDIELVEFMAPKTRKHSVFGDRLYGTLKTRRGNEFTGYLTWDVDEIFPDDILDGKERGRKRKIEFDRIKSIERYSSNGAKVYLKSGDDIILRDSNDVDDSNRGIIVSDPGFGQVQVKWGDFDQLFLEDTRKTVQYKKFDGGRRLKGTVFTEDGEKYRGNIRWDNDEEYTWELLDGEYRHMEFDIEFGLIKSIKKRSHWGSEVTVQDGRTFELENSNDIDENNKGIFVTLNDDEVILVEWYDFDRVEFER